MKLLRNLASLLVLTASSNASAALEVKNLDFVREMIDYMKAKGYTVQEKETRRTIMGYEGVEYETSVERSDVHLGDYRPIADTPYKYFFMCFTSRFVTTESFYDDTFGSCWIGQGEGQFKGEWATQVEMLSQKYNVPGFTCRGNGSSKSCTYKI